jgi:hypothetical protein
MNDLAPLGKRIPRAALNFVSVWRGAHRICCSCGYDISLF